MNNTELMNDRIRVIHDAARMEKRPYRVPHIGNVWNWMHVYMDEPLNTILRDYSLIERDLRAMEEAYNFDAIVTIALRNPLRIFDPIGQAAHHVDEKTRSVHIEQPDIMKGEEYPEFSADMVRMMWTKMMPRKFPSLCEPGGETKLLKSAEEFLLFTQKQTEFIDMLTKDYGMPRPMTGGETPMVMPSFEFFFGYFRGIRDAAIDLRRHKEELAEACAALDSVFVDPVFDQPWTPGPNDALLFDICSCFMGHIVMNRKQLDVFYQPFIKKARDMLVKNNKSLYIFLEGAGSPLWQYMEDIPKGHLAIQLDMDDIYQTRESLPNACLIGGMPSALLGNGTPDQCVDKARALVETVGANGGFMLSQDKMLSIRSDAKPENMKAVSEFIRDFRY